jgi:hypothetical protein
MPWPRQLLTGRSLWRPSFDPWPNYVGFEGGQIALGQCCLCGLHCSPVNTIQPRPPNHDVCLLGYDSMSLGPCMQLGSD